MKTREKLFWIIMLALLVCTMLLSAVLPKGEVMAIDFAGLSYNQYIKFSDIGNIVLPSEMSLGLWYELDNLPAADSTAFISVLGGNVKYYLWPGNVSGNKWFFTFDGFSTRGGVWSISNTFGTASKNLIVVTYDSSSYLNDPIIYVNGVSRSVAEVTTPSGTPVAKSGNEDLYIGGAGISLYDAPDGRSHKSFILPFIATADQIKGEWDSRGAGGLSRRAVFCPVLYGAKGLQVADGVTLSTSNLIIDPCSGASGTPTGSPVMVGEQYLSIR
jgi:hypothetical protein